MFIPPPVKRYDIFPVDNTHIIFTNLEPMEISKLVQQTDVNNCSVELLPGFPPAYIHYRKVIEERNGKLFLIKK